MKHRDEKKKIEGEPLPRMTSCHSVVDACGCVIGSYCCEGSDMSDSSKCEFHSC